MSRLFFYITSDNYLIITIAKNPTIQNKGANDPHIQIIEGKANI